MKSITRFLLIALALTPLGVSASPVPTTVGNNLTAYNPGGGNLNNNTWATSTNGRNSAGVPAPTADFGNCNSLILRCAQPKCAGGGCADMAVASTIVSGCVQSNATCSKHGQPLVDYIAAQLVADSAAAANAANAAAANAAAQQSAQQMQAMQQQMQTMQAEMAAQNAAQMQAMQAALDEQKQAAAAAQAQAAAAATATANAQNAANASGLELTDTQKIAAATGVDSSLLIREQIGGEIMTKIEDAEKALKDLRDVMNATFKYAGCDSMGNNCSGPKRVEKFKELAQKFFTPYENVTDEMYDALIDAMTIGVDITDVMMLLNNSCNRWGEYWCRKGQDTTYTEGTCINGRSVGLIGGGGPFGGKPCTPGGIIPETDNGCRLVRIYPDGEDITRAMLYGEEETGASGDSIRVACATDVLFSTSLFKKKAKPATIDIDTLNRMINQDSGRAGRSRNRNNNAEEVFKQCAIDETMYDKLHDYTARRTLPAKRLCIDEDRLEREFDNMVPIISTAGETLAARARENCVSKYRGAIFSEITRGCYCHEARDSSNQNGLMYYVTGNNPDCKVLDSGERSDIKCCDPEKTLALAREAHRNKCRSFGDAEWTYENAVKGIEGDKLEVGSNVTAIQQAHLGKCDCEYGDNNTDKIRQYNCKTAFGHGIVVTDGTGSGTEYPATGWKLMADPMLSAATRQCSDYDNNQEGCSLAGACEYDSKASKCKTKSSAPAGGGSV